MQRKMLFLGIKSIYIGVYRYLDLFPSADVGKHIFEKYCQVCEKAKQNILQKSATERIIIASMSEDNRQA